MFLRISGLMKEKPELWDGSIAQHAYWTARESASLTAGDLPEAAVWGFPPEEEEGKNSWRFQLLSEQEACKIRLIR